MLTLSTLSTYISILKAYPKMAPRKRPNINDRNEFINTVQRYDSENKLTLLASFYDVAEVYRIKKTLVMNKGYDSTISGR